MIEEPNEYSGSSYACNALEIETELQIPRHTSPIHNTSAWFISSIFSSDNRPSRLPIFSLGTDTILSTMICEACFNPFSLVGKMFIRNMGASAR